MPDPNDNVRRVIVRLTPAARRVTAVVRSAPNPFQLAKARGFTGTEEEWLASLQGVRGLSAYQVAVSEGFVGTVGQWLASLVGEKGDPFVYSDFTPEQLAALKGDPFVYSDFTPEQLAALKGADGSSATNYTRASDFDGVRRYIYAGCAPQGSPATSPVWRIKRITVTEDGSVSATLSAASVAWTDRASATYT